MLITFIIPTINRITLDRALKSLLSQSDGDWNAIVVGDGIMPLCGIRDDRITFIVADKQGYISNGHGRAGFVRNQALNHVKTEWIGFLDDDDTLDVDYVLNLKNCIKEKQSVDLILWRMIYTDGHVVPVINYDEIKLGNVGISFCFKKNLVSNIMFEHNVDGEDFYLFESLNKKCKELHISKKICYYVNH